MKIAYLFAGQGAQKVGMGADFYQEFSVSKDIYDAVNLDFDLKEICFSDVENKINQTEYTQSCLLATSLSIAKAVDSLGLKPSAVAGLSLGEYSALTYANALDFNSALNLVRQRGIIMASALPEGTTGMSAVINGDQEAIAKRIAEADIQSLGVVQIANYNSPKQIVLTGELSGLKKAEEVLKELNMGRVIPLKVSGAFHSVLLSEASKNLAKVLEPLEFKEPEVKVYYNYIGDHAKFSKELLTKQISNSVLFEKMVRQMISDGIDTFIEIGPGKTLTSFIKQIDPEVAVYTVESVEGLNALKGVLV